MRKRIEDSNNREECSLSDELFYELEYQLYDWRAAPPALSSLVVQPTRPTTTGLNACAHTHTHDTSSTTKKRRTQLGKVTEESDSNAPRRNTLVRTRLRNSYSRSSRELVAPPVLEVQIGAGSRGEASTLVRWREMP